MHWRAVAAGGPIDWHAVFDGYDAQVDWPGAAVWEQTATAFPDAKVLHTERPEEEWWNSFGGTIGKFFTIRSSLELPPPVAALFELMAGWFVTETFGPRIERESAIAAYRRNNEKVRDTIPADRLLVFTPRRRLGAALPVPGGAGPGDPLPTQPRPRRVLGPFRRRARGWLRAADAARTARRSPPTSSNGAL